MGCYPTRPDSQLPPDRAGNRVEGFAAGGPVPQFRARNQAGLALVLIEHLHLFARKNGIVDVEVGLVVQAERPVIEIGRTHRHPDIVHNQQLQWYIVGWNSWISTPASSSALRNTRLARRAKIRAPLCSAGARLPGRRPAPRRFPMLRRNWGCSTANSWARMWRICFSPARRLRNTTVRKPVTRMVLRMVSHLCVSRGRT